jgi:serine/threonine protein phosphatase PrpC
VRAALLRGREHVELGVVAALAEGDCAIALSRGGAAKRYPHSEPNEDAAGFALGAHGCFAAVADGHGGFEASEVALESLLAGPAAQWTDAPGPLDAEVWPRQARAALADAHEDVERERGLDETRRARSTLAFALALPAKRLLLHAALGDSHLFLADASGVRELLPCGEAVCFLGDASEGGAALAARARIGSEPLAGARAAVLVTDGLSERGIGVRSPSAAVAEALRLAERERGGARPLAVARALAEAALEAHRRNRAGDNVAVAVLWLSE